MSYETIMKCDRCKKTITNKTILQSLIYKQLTITTTDRIEVDLCKKCYKEFKVFLNE